MFNLSLTQEVGTHNKQHCLQFTHEIGTVSQFFANGSSSSTSAALPCALNIYPLTSITITAMIMMIKDCATVLSGYDVIIFPTTKIMKVIHY